MPRPDLTRVPAFYHNYISKVNETDLIEAFAINTPSFLSFLNQIPKEKLDYRYEEGKWSVREILQHLTDTERVFSYRALRIARKDKTPLPGFDENLFAMNAKADRREWDDLVAEFAAVRHATQLLFRSFDEEQLEAEGISSNQSVYVLGIGFICIGHCNHHRQVIEQRYL